MVQGIFGINHPHDFWKFSKMHFRQFIPNRPPKHVITNFFNEKKKHVIMLSKKARIQGFWSRFRNNWPRKALAQPVNVFPKPGNFQVILWFFGCTSLIFWYLDEDNTGAIMFGGVPHRCIKLEQLQQELVEASQPNLLNVENLNQVIIKALMINCFQLCFSPDGVE